MEGRPRLAQMRKSGTGAALTIVPVLMADGPNRDVADALGLTLEKIAYMRDVRTTDVAFTPPEGAGPEQMPALFGRWVRQQHFETEYVLLAEILGSPTTGVTEVRTTIVTRRGEVVWSDRQSPENATFKRLRPRAPMSCCLLVTERVKAALDVPRPDDEPVVDGRMARLWASKSGTPSAEERAAIRRRARGFCQHRGRVRLLVYPAQVNGTPDPGSVAGIVKAASAAGFAGALAADVSPTFAIRPTSNEQKRLWDLARACRRFVRENKPDADYVLFAEYLISPPRQRALAVHVVVCDRNGDWVVVDYQNSHHADFRAVRPKSVAECSRLLGRRLEHVCE